MESLASARAKGCPPISKITVMQKKARGSLDVIQPATYYVVIR